jgi:hypothetical protein
VKKISCLIIFSVIIGTAFTQNMVKSTDIDNTVKLIADSIPSGWIIKTDLKCKDEFLIQSPVIQLTGSADSNDPMILEEHCEIYILVLPRVMPDSINMLRKRNEELKQNLPPQNSKDNLKKWYEENEKTLKILDSEPTHYDNKYSYRIKCRRLPVNKKDLDDYNSITKYLNKLFIQY